MLSPCLTKVYTFNTVHFHIINSVQHAYISMLFEMKQYIKNIIFSFKPVYFHLKRNIKCCRWFTSEESIPTFVLLCVLFSWTCPTLMSRGVSCSIWVRLFLLSYMSKPIIKHLYIIKFPYSKNKLLSREAWMIWTLYSWSEKLIHKGSGHYLFLIKMIDKESTTVQELMEIQTQIFSNKNIGNCYKYLKVGTKCDYFSLW